MDGLTFKIKSAKNGWILETSDNGEVVGVDDYDNEVDCFISFLRAIAENYGPSAGRYDMKRIHVVGLPGDKWHGTLPQEMRETVQYIKDLCDIALESKDEG